MNGEGGAGLRHTPLQQVVRAVVRMAVRAAVRAVVRAVVREDVALHFNIGTCCTCCHV